MSSDLRLAITTCGSRDVADRIATALVEKRLAACVNVLPGVSSIYRWMGRIESDDEVLMLIKTGKSELTAIEGLIKALAGYELPELIAVELKGGAADYLDWVATSVGEETA